MNERLIYLHSYVGKTCQEESVNTACSIEHQNQYKNKFIISLEALEGKVCVIQIMILRTKTFYFYIL